MTPDQAARVLAYCAQNWPTMTVGDHTADVWAAALATVDAKHAQEAVRRLVQTDEYPPTVARIISAARGIGKGHEEHRALPAPRGDMGRAARSIRALNALCARMDRPAHDHRRGVDACPSCSTKAGRLKAFAREAAGLSSDDGVTIDAEAAARYAIEGQPG